MLREIPRLLGLLWILLLMLKARECRAFVLLPLAGIAPSLEVPGVGTVSVLLQRVDTSVLEQIKNS